MINALTEFLLNLLSLAIAGGLMSAGFLYLVQRPDKAKALLGRVVAGALWAAAGIMLANSYMHALAAGHPLAVGILVAASGAAYLVRLAKRRAGSGAPGNRRRLLGR